MSVHAHASPAPIDPIDALAVARVLAAELAVTAAARDRQGGTPWAERGKLRASGLLSIGIPRAFGGGGAPWPTVLEIVRVLAAADSSLAQVYGFQHVLLATCQLFGTPAQARRLLEATAQHQWFWGNALNPLDRRLAVIATPTGRVLRGDKSFTTGALDSDHLIVSALDGDRLIVAALPTDRAGIELHDDWDAIGQRQTDSGSVRFDGVTLAPDEVLHRSETAPTPRATLRTLVSQLVLTNLFVGIAEGALEEARRYVTQHVRPWINSGVEHARDDPYLLQRFGEMRLKAVGAQALATRAALALDDAWSKGHTLTADERAHVALVVSEAKIYAHRAALDVSESLFDACGARATGAPLALDRFWRNARVHTLHDPLDYRVRDVGRYALDGTLPDVSLYT